MNFEFKINVDMSIIPKLPGFPGYYVSRGGTIYTSLKQGCRNPMDESKRVPLHPVNPRSLPNGYDRVYLRCPDGKRRDFYVHRLVASVFIPNPENKPVVNHRDCMRSNNAVENLEWATVKENTEYSEKFGMMKRDKFGRFHHR